MQKARSHRTSLLLPLVSVWFQVLFHSSNRSAFHLSLTVLVHYRSLISIQPYRMVPADSRKISRVPRYSGYSQNINFVRVRDYHSLRSSFPNLFHLKINVHIRVLQPRTCLNKYGLGCSLFDRLYWGNHVCFIFLRLLRCFSSPSLPSNKLE